jgi:hypothetical protein
MNIYGVWNDKLQKLFDYWFNLKFHSWIVTSGYVINVRRLSNFVELLRVMVVKFIMRFWSLFNDLFGFVVLNAVLTGRNRHRDLRGVILSW